jgi:hypothetical protein
MTQCLIRQRIVGGIELRDTFCYALVALGFGSGMGKKEGC